MKDDRYKVLLVEDNELDREAFQRFVEEKDLPYNYTIAGSITEAKAILTAKRFDVILLDYLLGDGTAFDLFDLNREAPIILITGAGGEEVAVKAMKSDAYDYLIKDSKSNYLTILPTTVENVLNRKKAEDAFRESEEKYRTLVENVQDGVFILQGTPYPDLIFYNKACARMVGYTVEEMKGLTFQQYVAPEDLKRVTDYYRRKLAGDDLPKEYEFRVLHQDGKTRVYVSMNAGVFKYKGKAACIGTVKDITERKLAEEALRESEEKYRVLIENANEAIVVVQDGLFKLANSTIKELAGYSEEELKNKPFVEIIYPDDQEMAIERYHRRLEGEEVPRVYPIRIVDKAGNIKWVEVNAVVFSCKGRPATLIFLSDISERKGAEEALRESEERYRHIFEQNPLGIGLVSREGKVIACNKALETVTGYSREELTEGGIIQVYKNPGDRKALLEVISRDGYVLDHPVRLKRKDGSTYKALLNSALVKIGGEIYLQTIVQSITDLTNADAEH